MGALPPEGRARDEEREVAQKTLNALYRAARQHWPNFEKREGQVQMMSRILTTLMRYKDEGQQTTGENIAAVEGKTGSGKTLAYGLPALAVSHVTGKQIIISTGTVALQQQLFDRDLPNLAKVAAAVGIKLDFALLKGRNRYGCLAKMDAVQHRPNEDSPALPAASLQLVGRLRQAFESKRWSGDRDASAESIDDETWRAVQADRGSCTTRVCEFYKGCAFYASRNAAKAAKIIVANHSLVLSTLTTENKLFDLNKTLFVFDEGHQLVDIARDHFATHLPLRSSAKVLERLGRLLNKGGAFEPSMRSEITRVVAPLNQARTKLLQLHADLLDDDTITTKGSNRFEHGVAPEPLCALLHEIGVSIKDAYQIGGSIASMVRGNISNQSEPLGKRMQDYVGALGPLLLRADAMVQLTAMWNHAGRVPKAKWLSVDADRTQGQEVTAHASSLTPASELFDQVWSKVGAAVVTSATLTACGSFDYFAKVTGLNRLPDRSELMTESPFDYARQGELRIAKMRANPKDSKAFSLELQQQLPQRLKAGRNGQLAIFSSRRQMEDCLAALDPALRQRVLVQGSKSAGALIEEHTRRVRAGQGSILFGLKSFGEGIDLPGELCEHVYIDKLPFTPPESPVDEALAEWLAEQSRDAFAEIAVPKAGQMLTQWVGRGIRTTTDHASITLFDTRIVTAKYGKQLLKGLPPMPVINEAVVH
jgi:ATP-dependent DNA helicase DinG